MPSRRVHLTWAESNQHLAVALQASPYLDWSVTILFYAALHLVEATLAPLSHSRSHAMRDRAVQTDPRLQPIYLHYRERYDRSLDARYECIGFSQSYVQAVSASEYEPIKRHMQPLLGLTF